MKKIQLMICLLTVCSCVSNNRNYNAYYDMDNGMLVIENSDEYTTRMIWNSNYTPFSIAINVCLMPENKEISLEAIHVKD
jgi:hypothetical protein